MLKNRFEYWRLQLSVKRGKEITQRDMAKLLGVDYSQYNKWEVSRKPPSGNSLWYIWQTLLADFPKLNMQDLLENTLQ
ncbi:hypothetical protein SDC9_83459 [bioreactor metagenome]|uniref:HTH cro/C1-type domain-containing protein n=1 Tax=bioreactor metagenome TaxID=1076179 RepID=A0A644Z7L1_9ZZZZ